MVQENVCAHFFRVTLTRIAQQLQPLHLETRSDFFLATVMDDGVGTFVFCWSKSTTTARFLSRLRILDASNQF